MDLLITWQGEESCCQTHGWPPAMRWFRATLSALWTRGRCWCWPLTRPQRCAGALVGDITEHRLRKLGFYHFRDILRAGSDPHVFLLVGHLILAEFFFSSEKNKIMLFHLGCLSLFRSFVGFSTLRRTSTQPPITQSPVDSSKLAPWCKKYIDCIRIVCMFLRDFLKIGMKTTFSFRVTQRARQFEVRALYIYTLLVCMQQTSNLNGSGPTFFVATHMSFIKRFMDSQIRNFCLYYFWKSTT